jgi:hypothetical protein
VLGFVPFMPLGAPATVSSNFRFHFLSSLVDFNGILS